MDGNAHEGSGTSAATPMVAGLFASLNSIRYENRLPPLGFVNPFLYHYANTSPAGMSVSAMMKHDTPFRDIIEGHNDGCTGVSFYSTPGWDPATGLGLPNYQALKHIVQNMKR